MQPSRVVRGGSKPGAHALHIRIESSAPTMAAHARNMKELKHKNARQQKLLPGARRIGIAKDVYFFGVISTGTGGSLPQATEPFTAAFSMRGRNTMQGGAP